MVVYVYWTSQNLFLHNNVSIITKARIYMYVFLTVQNVAR